MQSYINDICDPSQMINPLFKHLGMEVKSVSDGFATLRLPTIPGFQQGGGVVAGGVLVTMADEAMALAAMSSTMSHVVTSEINSRFLRSVTVKKSEYLLAKASVIKSGRTIVTTEAKVYDSKENLLLVAGASFVVLANGKKADGSPAPCVFPESDNNAWGKTDE